MDFIDRDLLYSVAAFVVATTLMILYTRRKMRARWQGEVEDIKSFRRDQTSSQDDAAPHYVDYVRIRYRKSTGGHGSLTMKKTQYVAAFGELRAGDRLVKEPGSFYPRKVAPE